MQKTAKCKLGKTNRNLAVPEQRLNRQPRTPALTPLPAPALPARAAASGSRPGPRHAKGSSPPQRAPHANPRLGRASAGETPGAWNEGSPKPHCPRGPDRSGARTTGTRTPSGLPPCCAAGLIPSGRAVPGGAGGRSRSPAHRAAGPAWSPSRSHRGCGSAPSRASRRPLPAPRALT